MGPCPTHGWNCPSRRGAVVGAPLLLALPSLQPAAQTIASQVSTYSPDLAAKPWRGSGPKRGCQSNPDFQWRYQASAGDTPERIISLIMAMNSPALLAQLIAANPAKNIRNITADDTVLVPKSWNGYIDELGYPGGQKFLGSTTSNAWNDCAKAMAPLSAPTLGPTVVPPSWPYGFVRVPKLGGVYAPGDTPAGEGPKYTVPVPPTPLPDDPDFDSGYQLGILDCKSRFARSFAAGVSNSFRGGYHLGFISCKIVPVDPRFPSVSYTVPISLRDEILSRLNAAIATRYRDPGAGYGPITTKENTALREGKWWVNFLSSYRAKLLADKKISPYAASEIYKVEHWLRGGRWIHPGPGATAQCVGECDGSDGPYPDSPYSERT